MKKAYDKHIFSTLTEYLSEVESDSSNAERKTMNKSIKRIIKDLIDNNISVFPDFSLILKKFGMNYKDISELLNIITCSLNLNDIRHRLIFKSNHCEKNMLFTWISIHKSLQLIELIEKFYINKGIKPKKKKNNTNTNTNLREEINKLIKEIDSQKQVQNSTISYESLFINECDNEDSLLDYNDYEEEGLFEFHEFI